MPFNSIFSWLIKKRINQIDFFRKNPIEIQDKTFFDLINKASQTMWGELYNYSEIKISINSSFARVRRSKTLGRSNHER